MPTTLREQLVAGIHQTERQLNRIPDAGVRADLAVELEDYLEQVRAAQADDVVAALAEELTPIRRRVVDAAGLLP